MPEKTKTLKPISIRKYVKQGGGCCPFCKGGSLYGDSWELNDNIASQEVSCDDCGAVWIDEYKLSGFMVILEGESNA